MANRIPYGSAIKTAMELVEAGRTRREIFAEMQPAFGYETIRKAMDTLRFRDIVPPSGKKHPTVCSLRLSERAAARLSTYAKAEGISDAMVARMALMRGLDVLEERRFVPHKAGALVTA